ncbi:hypothetical protein LOTGIDRAFT_229878 [Lottia gigantea]|uniref:PH domain-containing protein n=1 Tax=Lottia gigantea TaxID=225164 RepID=V3ZFP1_LOTGI|nr:hypothetical protein LOTGIDRAFT_229878 [Lottia gigantea]ESO82907.1 hypothetical protein LOTGIDRAFT_229878 [Lottia gigantea]
MSKGETIRNHTVSKTLSVPLRFIGAQELMSTAPNAYSGFLAKRGRRERLVERFNLPNKAIFNDIKKWRKRFIIISQGCVYIYDKEISSRPHQSFPLYGYNRISKMGSDHDAFTFRLEGKNGGGFKIYYFSTATDEERKVDLHNY